MLGQNGLNITFHFTVFSAHIMHTNIAACLCRVFIHIDLFVGHGFPISPTEVGLRPKCLANQLAFSLIYIKVSAKIRLLCSTYVVNTQAAQALVVRSYYFFKKDLYANVQLMKRAIVT